MIRPTNKRTARRVAIALGVLTGLSVSGRASAQEWLKDRRYQEGIGVKAGTLELHPGVAGEIGYDSNWFLRSPKNDPALVNAAPNNPPVDGGVMRITPSLSLRTMGPQRKEGDAPEAAKPKIGFNANLSGTYREFVGPQVLRGQRNASLNADMRLDILPEHPVGFGVYGRYARTIQPNVLGSPDISFNRNAVGGGAEVIAMPGGGTLDWRLGYQMQATLFEESNGVPYDNLTHEGYTKGRWKFRPRTALLYDASMRFINYGNANRATQFLVNSTPVRARLGLRGLVTTRFALLAMAGYGASFYDAAAGAAARQYDSVIGQAEAQFYLTGNPEASEDHTQMALALSSVALGYNRDFANSLLGSYYGLDRGYLKFAYMFAGRALVQVEGGLAALSYPDAFTNTGGTGTFAQAAWTDARADATLYGEYRFTDTFGLNSTLRYTANFSPTQLPVAGAGPGGPNLFDLNWRRFEAYIGARWFL